MVDVREQQDGYVLGVLARLAFDSAVSPRGEVDLEALIHASRLFPPIVRTAVASLQERGLIDLCEDGRHWRLTEAGVDLIRHRRDREGPADAGNNASAAE